MLGQPYLFFDSRCEEAIEFYRKVLGAEVDMLMPFKDSPEPEAIQVASKWPGARFGNIEVRPVEEELRQDKRYG